MFAFNMQIRDQVERCKMFGRILNDKGKHRTLLHQSPTYTNVYIGTGRTCLFKGHLNRTVFNKVRVAQLVEHHTSDIRIVGSSPTMSIFFHLF